MDRATPDQPCTVVEAGDLWLRRAVLDELEESTIRQYEQHLRLHIAPFLGSRALGELTPPVLEDFKDELLRTRSRAMARKVLTSLKGVFGEAVRRGVVAQNPALALRVRTKRRAHGQIGTSAVVPIPSKADIRELLQKSRSLFPLEGTSIQGTWWHAFFVVAVFTGMRASELRGLAWANTDLDRRVISVRQRADFKGRIGPPKSAAGNRDIPMTPMVVRVLTWKARCPSTELGLVFPSRNGRVQTLSNIHKMCWGPLQLETGLTRPSSTRDGPPRPRLSFHSLRHAAATLFIEQGWPPKKVQNVLGHSSIQVTFDIYGKLWQDLDGDLAAMANVEKALIG